MKLHTIYPILIILVALTVALAACAGSTAEEPASAAQDPGAGESALQEAEESSQPVAEAPEAGEQQASYPAPAPTQPPAGNADDAYPPPQPTIEAVQQSYPAEGVGDPAVGLRTFIIDPAGSSAAYLADEEFLEDALSKLGIAAGEVDVVGTTDNVAGQIQFSPSDLSTPGDTLITADLSGLSTDQNRRDSWVQENNNGPQFARFPQATFKATGISDAPSSYNEGEEAHFHLHGDLTVREVTRPVTFEVTAVLEGDTLTGIAETRLLMSDFGINPPVFARTLSVADEIGIRVNLVAHEGK